MATIYSGLWYHYPYNGTITFYHDLTFCCRNILIKFLNKILIKFLVMILIKNLNKILNKILIKLLTSAQVVISIHDTSLVNVSVTDILCKAMYASADAAHDTMTYSIQYQM